MNASSPRPLRAQESGYGAKELSHFVLGENVAERQHRRRVATLANPTAGAAPTLLRGCRRTRCGNRCLDRVVAPAQGVIVRVGDVRRVLLVIGAVVMRDLGGEPFQLRFAPASEARRRPVRPRLSGSRRRSGDESLPQRRARFVGHRGARQHARDLLAPWASSRARRGSRPAPPWRRAGSAMVAPAPRPAANG